MRPRLFLDQPRRFSVYGALRSILLAEVAAQMGHSPPMTLSEHVHVVDEFAGRPPVDCEEEIRRAREAA